MSHENLTMMDAGHVTLIPCWLFSQSFYLNCSVRGTGPLLMLVYRSIALREGSKRFAPVLAELSKFRHRIEAQHTFADPWMMFGEGERTLYQLKHPDDLSEFVDLDPGLDNAITARGIQILGALTVNA